MTKFKVFLAFLGALAATATSFAQEASSTLPDPAAAQASALQPDKRAYGVLPNYRMADSSVPFAPITSHQKLMIGVNDSFDGAAYPLAAFFSGIAQLDNSNPSFGQGVKGYAHRYITAFSDQVSGNLLTESLLPIVLHEDPRFFRKGSGSKKARVLYAATRVLVCKNDEGRPTFNVAEVLGNGMVGALGNSYYPDARGFNPTMQRMFTQIGTDSISNVLKEFWPDVKEHYAKKRREKLELQQKTAQTRGM